MEREVAPVAGHDARPQRSDWQRNHEQLVAVAATLIDRDGAQVSLEKIAREAGVGSATLHRHFPSRRALLEEVFRAVVERFRLRADELAADDPRTGLVTWLEELTLSAADSRGLTAALEAAADGEPPAADSCHGMVREATVMLLDRARAVGAVRPEVSPDDLLALGTAVSLATEGDPAAARRLLRLAIDGVRP
ncbi:TetR/AcrR family transcriptional regulator [Streptomyces boncukensis]|uniref:TetR/AcrR family transcriptional regulator n=1 Tax=Streptomyces boncukensis TaxID=2711219 RepID=A0A6G4X3G1_9ACTN|nr:TetR/AcrR family transcriptional regulator [Streptomyces boncukensis]NGO72045.1 TetR/AcrR family transcriptional regulator [Streptomyces boncukensis]